MVLSFDNRKGNKMFRHFMELLTARQVQGKHVCVGLDPVPAKIERIRGSGSALSHMTAFLREVVEATADVALAYKPNFSFFMRKGYGLGGPGALYGLIQFINKVAPGVPVVFDGKRADIGKSNEGYVDELDLYGADAMTVHPYLGQKAMRPFLDRGDKGFFVLTRTSNPGAGEFQDMRGLGTIDPSAGTLSLYEHVARNVSMYWNGNGNCSLVAGATYPKELARIRKLAPNLPILIPGIGAQGGDLEATIEAARGGPNLVNSSSGIVFAILNKAFLEAHPEFVDQPGRAVEAAGVAAKELDAAICACSETAT
jgi:orotidine-5'-phosphate decarboxylase